MNLALRSVFDEIFKAGCLDCVILASQLEHLQARDLRMTSISQLFREVSALHARQYRKAVLAKKCGYLLDLHVGISPKVGNVAVIVLVAEGQSHAKTLGCERLVSTLLTRKKFLRRDGQVLVDWRSIQQDTLDLREICPQSLSIQIR